MSRGQLTIKSLSYRDCYYRRFGYALLHLRQ